MAGGNELKLQKASLEDPCIHLWFNSGSMSDRKLLGLRPGGAGYKLTGLCVALSKMIGSLRDSGPFLY